jgi:hypothetical protein
MVRNGVAGAKGNAVAAEAAIVFVRAPYNSVSIL